MQFLFPQRPLGRPEPGALTRCERFTSLEVTRSSSTLAASLAFAASSSSGASPISSSVAGELPVSLSRFVSRSAALDERPPVCEDPIPDNGAAGPTEKRVNIPLPTPLRLLFPFNATAAQFAPPLGQPLGQPHGHVARRLRPFVRLLGHHRLADFHERRRRIRPGLENRFRPGRLMLQQPLGDRAFRERRAAGEQEIERAAQAVDVRAAVRLVAVECLFRGQVSRPCPARSPRWPS